jgi:hypothetical protein
MPWAAAAAAVGTVAGAYLTSQGQQDAAQTQANAALQQSGNLLAAGRGAAGQFTPYTDIGQTALNQLNTQLPYLTQQFTNADLNAQLAPNYAFQLQQGEQANQMASNASGGAVGGNALSALNQYGQNYAQNAYQNALSNFTGQQTNIYNKLAGISQLGLTGATGSANAQLGTATNVANLGVGTANAIAASQIGQANAYGGAANTLGSIGYGYAMQNMNQPFNANQVAMGASPGGSFTPTAGNSFEIHPA